MLLHSRAIGSSVNVEWNHSSRQQSQQHRGNKIFSWLAARHKRQLWQCRASWAGCQPRAVAAHATPAASCQLHISPSRPQLAAQCPWQNQPARPGAWVAAGQQHPASMTPTHPPTHSATTHLPSSVCMHRDWSGICAKANSSRKGQHLGFHLQTCPETIGSAQNMSQSICGQAERRQGAKVSSRPVAAHPRSRRSSLKHECIAEAAGRRCNTCRPPLAGMQQHRNHQQLGPPSLGSCNPPGWLHSASRWPPRCCRWHRLTKLLHSGLASVALTTNL